MNKEIYRRSTHLVKSNNRSHLITINIKSLLADDESLHTDTKYEETDNIVSQNTFFKDNKRQSTALVQTEISKQLLDRVSFHFRTDIRCPQRMTPTAFCDPLTFPLVRMVDQKSSH